MYTDEKKWIADLQHANTQNKAFEVLIKQYKRPLYYHIRHIVLNHDDADDVLQNTFVSVYKGISKFRGDSQLYSWIFRIATNEALLFIKNKAKKGGVSNEKIYEKAVNNLESDVYFDADETQLLLQKAIAKLPEKQQLVFKMKYLEEMKYETISELLNTSVGALKASYFHAHKKIEAILKQQMV